MQTMEHRFMEEKKNAFVVLPTGTDRIIKEHTKKWLFMIFFYILFLFCIKNLNYQFIFCFGKRGTSTRKERNKKLKQELLYAWCVMLCCCQNKIAFIIFIPRLQFQQYIFFGILYCCIVLVAIFNILCLAEYLIVVHFRETIDNLYLCFRDSIEFTIK